MPSKRERLDKLLVTRALVASRDRAVRLILAGQVRVAGQRVDKPGTLVSSESVLELQTDDIPFVSRGGLKLAAALDHWQIDVRGQRAVDIGASTGGFTDCLLQRGAKHVDAIDVGYGQLAWSLRQDPRVSVFERANVREFDPQQLIELADLVVIDVSFISLQLVLPAALRLAQPQALLLPMVKPQFEVGKGKVGKGGVVRDPELRQQAVDKIRDYALTLGLRCHGQFASPTPGPKGNVEFFLFLERESQPPPLAS